MSGSLFVFSGLDGAGKSTQIDLLADHLRMQQGRRVEILWSRGGYTPGMLLLKRVLRSGARLVGKKEVAKSGPSRERTAAFGNDKVRWCWQSLAILDLLLLYGIWMRFKLWTGTTVICDRYWQDTDLDFQLNFPRDRVSKRLLWRCLQTFSPTAKAGFLLLIPVDESQRRSQLKNEPFPDSAETLAKRLKHYQGFRETDPSWHTIDGTQSISDVAIEIRSIAVQQPQDKVTC